jgi:hypothetical protein
MSILTKQQIIDQFPDEWVLIDEPEFDDALEVTCGRVAFHSGNKNDIYKADRSLQLKKAAYLFTGNVGINKTYVL